MTLDWGGLMRVGLHDMGLSPAQFWDLSPAEFLVLLGESALSAPMGRARLSELSAAYPDERTTDE